MSAITVQPILEPSAEPGTERPQLMLVPTGADAQGFGRTAPAGPVRITRRGRLALTLAAVGLIAAVGFGASTAMASASTPTTRTVTVLPGQTLSEIAASELPGVALGNAVVEIQVANALSTDQVHAGQTLTIPVG